MAKNSVIEMRWINAWNDLCELAGNRSGIDCRLPDGRVVDIETCKGWIQESAYQGWEVKVESSFFSGTEGVIVSRWRSA